MRAYVVFLTSAGLTVAALLAAIVLHGGWEAGAAAVALAVGTVCLASVVVLMAHGDHPLPR